MRQTRRGASREESSLAQKTSEEVKTLLNEAVNNSKMTVEGTSCYSKS